MAPPARTIVDWFPFFKHVGLSRSHSPPIPYRRRGAATSICVHWLPFASGTFLASSLCDGHNRDTYGIYSRMLFLTWRPSASSSPTRHCPLRPRPLRKTHPLVFLAPPPRTRHFCTALSFPPRTPLPLTPLPILNTHTLRPPALLYRSHAPHAPLAAPPRAPRRPRHISQAPRTRPRAWVAMGELSACACCRWFFFPFLFSPPFLAFCLFPATRLTAPLSPSFIVLPPPFPSLRSILLFSSRSALRSPLSFLSFLLLSFPPSLAPLPRFCLLPPSPRLAFYSYLCVRPLSSSPHNFCGVVLFAVTNTAHAGVHLCAWRACRGRAGCDPDFARFGRRGCFRVGRMPRGWSRGAGARGGRWGRERVGWGPRGSVRTRHRDFFHVGYTGLFELRAFRSALRMEGSSCVRAKNKDDDAQYCYRNYVPIAKDGRRKRDAVVWGACAVAVIVCTRRLRTRRRAWGAVCVLLLYVQRFVHLVVKHRILIWALGVCG
ncbi:hypothetical protein C8J57DRAFT_1535221 [Mycena rebaudengoi]|nr:hypothetical protein C8J57DRAFT_1535221 [Mycena rebaudengoi]